VALPLGEYPSYIFPFSPASEASRSNLTYFQSSMYRPLYVVGKGPQLGVQYDLSPANAPVFSNGNTTITLTMKGWNFSNGDVIDGRSVVFFFNLWRAAPSVYYDSLAGSVSPDKILSVTASGLQVTITTTVPVQPDWFLYNVLARVTPMPQAWDRTTLANEPGSAQCSSNLSTYTTTTARTKCGAPARPVVGRAEYGVVKFLRARASDTTTYVADDPIWGVTSGPWRLGSYDRTRVAPVVLVPSANYDGPVPASVAQLRLVPFTTIEAERAALQSGTLDVGYLNATDVTPPTGLYPNGRIKVKELRDRVVARYSPLWQSTFAYVNFNASTGASSLVRQLYFRQALQSSIDQSSLITGIYGRAAYPNWSAVPIQPPTTYSAGVSNPYPFNLVRAKKFLTDNGWTVPLRGVATCGKDGGCGAGVPKGARAEFTYTYFNSGPLVTQRLAAEQAQWARIGVQVTLNPIDKIERITRECASGSKGTSWQVCELAPWAYYPDTFPSGETLFGSNSVTNIGRVSDATMDAIVTATSRGDESLASRYTAYSATQLPVIFQPNRGIIVAWSKSLKSALGPSPAGAFLPEFFRR
jgi:peptide/nickel transport system substrate-binding protein